MVDGMVDGMSVVLWPNIVGLRVRVRVKVRVKVRARVRARAGCAGAR